MSTVRDTRERYETRFNRVGGRRRCEHIHTEGRGKKRREVRCPNAATWLGYYRWHHRALYNTEYRCDEHKEELRDAMQLREETG